MSSKIKVPRPPAHTKIMENCEHRMTFEWLLHGFLTKNRLGNGLGGLWEQRFAKRGMQIVLRVGCGAEKSPQECRKDCQEGAKVVHEGDIAAHLGTPGFNFRGNFPIDI